MGSPQSLKQRGVDLSKGSAAARQNRGEVSQHILITGSAGKVDLTIFWKELEDKELTLPSEVGEMRSVNAN